jgi:hypothetical protein
MELVAAAREVMELVPDAGLPTERSRADEKDDHRRRQRVDLDQPEKYFPPCQSCPT